MIIQTVRYTPLTDTITPYGEPLDIDLPDWLNEIDFEITDARVRPVTGWFAADGTPLPWMVWLAYPDWGLAWMLTSEDPRT